MCGSREGERTGKARGGGSGSWGRKRTADGDMGRGTETGREKGEWCGDEEGGGGGETDPSWINFTSR